MLKNLDKMEKIATREGYGKAPNEEEYIKAIEEIEKIDVKKFK